MRNREVEDRLREWLQEKETEIDRLTKESDELRKLYVDKCIEIRAIREYYEGKDDKTSGLQE